MAVEGRDFVREREREKECVRERERERERARGEGERERERVSAFCCYMLVWDCPRVTGWRNVGWEGWGRRARGSRR